MENRIITIEPFVYICMTGFFLSLVSTPQLILENRCTKYYNETTCQAMYKGLDKGKYDKIQEEAALWIAAYKVICNSVTLLALPTVGTVSDLFGRHQAMFLVPISLILRSSCMMLALKDGKSFDTWLLLIIGPIPSLVGGISGLILLATAYVSDITLNDQRTLRITLIDASSVMAAFTATLISGFIIQSFGYIGVYAGIFCLMILALFYWKCFIKPISKPSRACQIQPAIARITSSHACVQSPSLSLVCSENETLNDQRENSAGWPRIITEGGGLGTKEETAKSKALEKHQNTTAKMELVSLTSDEQDHGNLSRIKGVHACKGDLNGGDAIWGDANEVDIHQGDASKGDLGSSKLDDELTDGDSDMKHYDINIYKPCDCRYMERCCAPKCTKMTKVWHASRYHKSEERKVQNCKENRKEFINRLKDAANPFQNFLRITRAVKGTENIKLKIALLVITAMATFSKTGELNVFIIFLRNYPFYLSPKEIGFLMAFQNGSLAVIGLILFNTICQRYCKIDDLVMIMVSSSLGIIYFTSMALARSIVVLYLIQMLHAVCYLSIPTIRAFLSKTSSTTKLGAVIGLVGMVETLSSVMACFSAPIIYSTLASVSPGAVHFIFTFCMVIATTIAINLYFVYPKKLRMEKDRRVQTAVDIVSVEYEGSCSILNNENET